jgi:hypothetical protein
MALATFAKIIVAEVLCWRIMEIAVIVSYGTNRFGRGPRWWWRQPRSRPSRPFSLPGWPMVRLRPGAGTTSAPMAWQRCSRWCSSIPRVRLRWKPALYIRRWVDAVSVAGAEMLFYIQSELDKVLVLSLGGPETAGIYAMIMRLVDLTALPVRAFLTVLTQRLMRTSAMLNSLKNRMLLEGGLPRSRPRACWAWRASCGCFPMRLAPMSPWRRRC